MRNTYLFLIAVLILNAKTSFAQPKIYTMQNAHSHNDYLHEKPFFEAFSLGFGMIEVDIFEQNNELMVAHEKKSIQPEKTFSRLYLNPLIEQIKQSQGQIYPNNLKIRLLIDIKENGDQVLRLLENQMKPYRNYFDIKNNPNAVQIIISGDMPKSEDFKNYDKVFYFDGRPKRAYSRKDFKRVPLISCSILDFVKWNKQGIYSEIETKNLQKYVDSVHRVGKLVRFWATPNSISSFKTLTDLGVDFVGTDDLQLLSEYFKQEDFKH
jgi:alkaline phosphatase